MIFVVDNNGQFSDHKIYFVSADPHFLDWFRGVLLPHLRDKAERDVLPSIVASATSFAWREKDTSITPDDLVDRLVPIFESEPPVYRKVARPRVGRRVRSKDGKRRGVVDGVDLRSRRPMVLWDNTHYAVIVTIEEIVWD